MLFSLMVEGGHPRSTWEYEQPGKTTLPISWKEILQMLSRKKEPSADQDLQSSTNETSEQSSADTVFGSSTTQVNRASGTLLLAI